ncbi:unnamed protein product [Ostreobium quekettii]|uniref:20 kDa chaperonin, chloroplastic n=1 Tax=Ostreobium quekettii TaxID=121088 RepID=A0A8S1IWT8_9CHLO|nr:unnamed protein product [Ostreobium quekettii]|eukprot:evm.model.scf_156.8 EVM.evm.TU.scf_156.8   scf_156:74703-78864(+)
MSLNRFSTSSLHQQAIRPVGRAARGAPVRVHAGAALPAEYKTVTPLGQRVFVRVDSADATTVGGIMLPSSAQKAPTQGEVVAAFQDSNVKVGDRIVYSKYAGTEVAMDSQEHVLLKEEEVVGIMTSADVKALAPVADRILVEVSDVDAATSGGVLLTSGAQEKPTFGKVVAVGPGKKGENGEVTKPDVKIGTKVLYSKYSGIEFEDNDRKYIVIRENDILAELA